MMTVMVIALVAIVGALFAAMSVAPMVIEEGKHQSNPRYHPAEPVAIDRYRDAQAA